MAPLLRRGTRRTGRFSTVTLHHYALPGPLGTCTPHIAGPAQMRRPPGSITRPGQTRRTARHDQHRHTASSDRRARARHPPQRRRPLAYHLHDQAPVRREAMLTARRPALVGTAMTSGILARPSRQTFGGGGTYESRSRPARLGPFVGPGSNGSPCRAAAPLPCNGCMQTMARAAPSGRGHGFQAAPAQAAGRTGPFWQFASDATTAPVQRAGAGGPMTNSSRSCAVHEQAKHHLVRAARGRPSVWKER